MKKRFWVFPHSFLWKERHKATRREACHLRGFFTEWQQHNFSKKSSNICTNKYKHATMRILMQRHNNGSKYQPLCIILAKTTPLSTIYQCLHVYRAYLPMCIILSPILSSIVARYAPTFIRWPILKEKPPLLLILFVRERLWEEFCIFDSINPMKNTNSKNAIHYAMTSLRAFL